MRRGNDAYVHGDRRGAANALDLSLLQDAQQLCLGHGVHLADLVKKHRAALGLLELTHAPGRGAGEGASLMPEQLALYERLGDRRTIHRDERAFASGAVDVDGPSDELLAGAAFALDQHRDVVAQGRVHEREHLAHRPAVADQAVETVISPQLSAQPEHLALHFLDFGVLRHVPVHDDTAEPCAFTVHHRRAEPVEQPLRGQSRLHNVLEDGRRVGEHRPVRRFEPVRFVECLLRSLPERDYSA